MSSFDLTFPPEALADRRWGDLVTSIGPFIVTTRGIFTDFFVGEIFLHYPHVYIHTEDKNYIQRTEHTRTYVSPLFAKPGVVNGEIPLFRQEQYQHYTKHFWKAFDKAQEIVRE